MAWVIDGRDLIGLEGVFCDAAGRLKIGRRLKPALPWRGEVVEGVVADGGAGGRGGRGHGASRVGWTFEETLDVGGEQCTLSLLGLAGDYLPSRPSPHLRAFQLNHGPDLS